MLIILLLMISLDSELITREIHFNLLWFELRDINRNSELLGRILDLERDRLGYGKKGNYRQSNNR